MRVEAAEHITPEELEALSGLIGALARLAAKKLAGEAASEGVAGQPSVMPRRSPDGSR